ncbi:MAG: hypothetical protein HY344_03210 [Candidatus Levybacteria bacterium]|nr:hypothetical protein [Candidatus Levybacteria bacterium]
MDNTQNPSNDNDLNAGVNASPVQNPNTNGQYPNGQAAPSINKEVERPVSDYVARSDIEPVVDKEMEQVGVQTVSDRPVLDEDHEKIGVTHSLETNVPKTEASGTVDLMDEKEAKDVINKYKNSADPIEHVEQAYFLPSIFGFATVILKNLKEMHKRLTGKKD